VELTVEQRAVVATRDRPLLVRAGPGSGKTRTLAQKFLALVESGTAPDRVLALTFSKKAAAEMQHRLEEETRRSHRGLWISTFHSFGYALVERFRVDAELPRSYRLLTGFKEWVLLRDVLERVRPTSSLRTAVRYRGLVGHVANAIGALKQGLVSPDALEASLAGVSDEVAEEHPLLQDLVSVYRAYEAELRARRHFDYRDLIWRAIRLVEDNPEVRARIQSWFDAVLVDELQDIDAAQLRLVSAIASGTPLAEQFTAFGDVNQSIYGFRGALPAEVIASLRTAFPGLEARPLSHNFRSLPGLIDLAKRVVPSDMAAPAERAVEAAPSVPVQVLEGPTSLAEATAIARALARAKREGRPDGSALRWSDMAVLCRSLKRDGKAIENELERLEIPYRVHGNASFYRNPAVAFLVNYLLALAADGPDSDDGPLRRVLASPVPGLPQVPLARFLNRVVRRDRHAGRYLWYLRFIMEREDADAYPIWRPDSQDEAEAEDEVSRERERSSTAREPYFYRLMTVADKQAFYDFHQSFLFVRARARKAKDALPSLVAVVAARSGLTDWILRLAEENSRLAERHAANVSKLQAMVREFTEIAREQGTGEPPTLADLAAHLRQLLEHFSHESEVDAPAEEFYDPTDAVAVMTVHQAKGLEFDVVAVPHLVVGRLPAPPRPGVVLSSAAASCLEAAHPLYRDPTQPDPPRHYAEERRLFYVAVTRAKRRLVLSWAHRYDGEEEESAPSPFLVEALGGSEETFWRDVQDRGLRPGQRLAELAAASAAPRVQYRDVDEVVTDLSEVASSTEADVVLRRLYREGDEAVREAIEAAVRPVAAEVGIDWNFVSAENPFPPEPARPLALDREEILLSASRLADFTTCPRKFFYSKLLHLEPVTRSRAVFGTVVHEVLERFHTEHPDKQAFEDPVRRPKLRAELRGALEEELRANADRFGTEFQLRQQLVALDEIVDRYVALQREEPLRYVVGREVQIEFRAAGARLVAKLDRVVADAERLEDASEVLIADYKTIRKGVARTGRALSGRIKRGTELQLVTYRRALLEEYGVAAPLLGLIYLRHGTPWRPGTLEPVVRVMAKSGARQTEWWGKSGRQNTDRAYIAPDELEDAWEGVEGLVESVFEAARPEFEITPGSHCKWCDFKATCGKE